MIVNDLLFGEPIYDENNKVTHRNFGVKNFIIWGIILYFIMNQSHGKQRGGAAPIRAGDLQDLYQTRGIRGTPTSGNSLGIPLYTATDTDFSGGIDPIVKITKKIAKNATVEKIFKWMGLVLFAVIVVGGIAFLIINKMNPSFTKNITKNIKKII